MLNSQDSRGQTPLHVAASLNRTDVVSLFLAQDDVDDMVKDSQGKTCSEVGGGSDVVGLISGTLAALSLGLLGLAVSPTNTSGARVRQRSSDGSYSRS